MGKGLVDGAKTALAGRAASIDAAVDDATASKATPAAPEKKYEKPITAAEAEANQARRKAADAEEEKTRSMPKPGVLSRMKKMLVGE